jgi:two-component system, cell cycle response regulator
MSAMSPSVLVVDDEAMVRRVLGMFLTKAGMSPTFAANGFDGLAHARAERPDAIVCDLDMPGMDGVALCAALRADGASPRVPIVVVTGAGEDRLRAALAAGCDAVLPKPCSRALLIATIRDLLGLREELPYTA